MAAISNNNIARAIYATLKGKNETEQKALYPKVVDFLNRKRLLSKAPDILRRLDQIVNTEEGKLEAKVYTARPLSESVKNELSGAIARKYGRREVIIKEYLNERMLGGWRIEIGDEVIDLSLKNKIKKLQEHLTKRI
jgi:F-type H+-transporting ATPase subunit delta